MIAFLQKRLFLAALISIAQISFLGSMIASRANILRSGSDIRLTVEPVDPRDLLRGDYVVLGYPISRLDRSLLGTVESGDLEGRWIFVRLAHSEDETTKVVLASMDKPAEAARAENELDLRGIVQREPQDGDAISVSYGIERYYVPEGEGRAIEDAMRQDRFEIVAAVSTNGQAQIKALLHEGRPVYSEPLF